MMLRQLGARFAEGCDYAFPDLEGIALDILTWPNVRQHFTHYVIKDYIEQQFISTAMTYQLFSRSRLSDDSSFEWKDDATGYYGYLRISTNSHEAAVFMPSVRRFAAECYCKCANRAHAKQYRHVTAIDELFAKRDLGVRGAYIPPRAVEANANRRTWNVISLEFSMRYARGDVGPFFYIFISVRFEPDGPNDFKVIRFDRTVNGLDFPVHRAYLTDDPYILERDNRIAEASHRLLARIWSDCRDPWRSMTRLFPIGGPSLKVGYSQITINRYRFVNFSMKEGCQLYADITPKERASFYDLDIRGKVIPNPYAEFRMTVRVRAPFQNMVFLRELLRFVRLVRPLLRLLARGESRKDLKRCVLASLIGQTYSRALLTGGGNIYRTGRSLAARGDPGNIFNFFNDVCVKQLAMRPLTELAIHSYSPAVQKFLDSTNTRFKLYILQFTKPFCKRIEWISKSSHKKLV